MAHELTMNNGVAEMAFTGDRSKIWHGLGQELTPGSPLEVWAKEAGMNWEIESTALNFIDTEGEVHDFEGQQVLYRSDTKAPLSVVSSRYKVVQPGEILEFFRSLVTDVGMELSTAGTLFGGKRMWALADTKQAVLLNGKQDIMKGYLLLTTSCDGTASTSAQFTSVRVVCNNTLGFAMSDKAEKKNRVTTSHSTTFKPNEVKFQLGLYESAWDKFSKSMEQMTQIKVSSKDAYNDLLELFSVDASDPTPAEVRTVNEVHNLYLGAGKGADLAGQTVFGLLNSVTEQWDHHTGRNSSNILYSNFWGRSDREKTAAMNYLSNKYGIAA